MWLYMKLREKYHVQQCQLTGTWIPAFAGMTSRTPGVIPVEAGVQTGVY